MGLCRKSSTERFFGMFPKRGGILGLSSTGNFVEGVLLRYDAASCCQTKGGSRHSWWLPPPPLLLLPPSLGHGCVCMML